MGGVSCLLRLGRAVTSGGIIRFWGAYGVCVADRQRIVWRRGSDSGDCFLKLLYLFWGGYYDREACIPRPMQMI